MNDDQLIKSMELPKSTHVLRNFPYNKIEPQLNTVQRKVVSEQVLSRGIRILAIISTNNTNIPKFEDERVRYEEIHFYAIQLHNLKKATDVYKVFAQIIPYPLVIVFTDGEHTRWVMATHQKQKQTHLLTTNQIFEFDESITLEQVESNVSFSTMDKLDMKRVYHSWIEQLLQVELKGKYGLTRDITLENNLVKQLKELDRQIELLVAQAKREKQMNKRIALQVEANKLKNAKQALMERE